MSLQSRRSWWRVLYSDALSASVSLQLSDQRGEDAQEQLEHLCADQTWGFEWALSTGSLSITMHSLLVFGVYLIKIWLVYKTSSRLSTAFSHLEITLLWMPVLLYSLFSSCCSEIGASLVLRAAAPEARSRHSHKRDWQGIKLSQSVEKMKICLTLLHHAGIMFYPLCFYSRYFQSNFVLSSCCSKTTIPWRSSWSFCSASKTLCFRSFSVEDSSEKLCSYYC